MFVSSRRSSVGTTCLGRSRARRPTRREGPPSRRTSRKLPRAPSGPDDSTDRAAPSTREAQAGACRIAIAKQELRDEKRCRRRPEAHAWDRAGSRDMRRPLRCGARTPFLCGGHRPPTRERRVRGPRPCRALAPHGGPAWRRNSASSSRHRASMSRPRSGCWARRLTCSHRSVVRSKSSQASLSS